MIDENFLLIPLYAHKNKDEYESDWERYIFRIPPKYALR